MKPVEFKECNIKFAENQDEYILFQLLRKIHQGGMWLLVGD